MEHQEAKIIIAHFLKIEPLDINDLTVMDNSVVPSSLLLHRMYAALADKGYIVDDPASIITYGDFIENISITGKNHERNLETKKSINEEDDRTSSIGIDIQNLTDFNAIGSVENSSFYKENFSLEEIQYCESKANKQESFLGLFALKEAIVKADNFYKNISFNQIEIKHTALGKPIFKKFSVSISHSGDYIVAVAYKSTEYQNDRVSPFYLEKNMIDIASKEISKNNKYLLICFVAVVLSISTIFLIIS